MLTKRKKNRCACLILALILTQSAVGCSFVSVNEKTDETNLSENEPDSMTETQNQPSNFDEAIPNTIYDIAPLLTVPCDELFSTMERIETDEAYPDDMYTINVTGLSVPVKLYMRMDSVAAVEAHGHYVELTEPRDIYGNCDFELFEADGAVILEGGHYGIDDIYILTPEKTSEIHPGEDASYYLSVENGRLRYHYTHNHIADITQTGALSVAVSYDEFLYSVGDASVVNGEVVFAEPDESYVMSDKYDLDEEFERIWSGSYGSIEEKFAANRTAREEFAAERARREAFAAEVSAIEELQQARNSAHLYVGYIESADSETIDICSINGTVMSRIPREILADFPAADGTETGILRIPFYYDEYTNEDYSTFRWVIACSPTAMGSGTQNVCTSTDKGATWWVGTASRFEGSVTDACFVSENVGFISHQYWSDNGPNISRTVDGGKTWERMEIEIPEELSGYRMIPYTPQRKDDVLLYPVVLYGDSGAVDKVNLISRDGGLTWECETKESESSMQAYQSVLENQTPLYDTSAKQEMLLGDWLNSAGLSIQKYSVIDLNGDNEYEMVLWLDHGNYTDYGFEVLHCENNTVYAYGFPYRGFNDLKADGTYHWSGGAGHHGTAAIDFAGDTYTETNLAYCDDVTDPKTIHYYIGDRLVTKEEFDLYESEQGGKPDAVWVEYTAGN